MSLFRKAEQQSGTQTFIQFPRLSQSTSGLPVSPEMALIDFLVACRLPFNIVSDISFRNFAQIMQQHPEYVIPHRNTVSKMLPAYYRDSVSTIINSFEDCKYLSVTTDGWTGHQGQNFWSVTLHGIDSKTCSFKSEILACVPVYGKHTAQRLAQILSSKMKDLNIDFSKLVAIVTDEGGPAPCIGEQLGLESIHCGGHILQTVQRRAFDKAILETPVIGFVLSICKTLASTYSHSTAFRTEILAAQLANNEPTTGLVQDVVTRWNSRLYCLKSIAKCERSIKNWLVQNPPIHENLQLMERAHRDLWPVVHDIIAVLEPFDYVTKQLSQDQVPTLHLVIDNIISLEVLLAEFIDTPSHSDVVKTLAKTLLAELKAKYRPWNYFEYIAFFLNPSNVVNCLNDDWKKCLKKGRKRVAKHLSNVTAPSVELSQPPQVDDRLQLSPMQQRFAGLKRLAEPIVSPSQELATYESIVGTYAQVTDPMVFWKMHEKQLPQMFDLAIKVLSIPATQTTSEREFSLMKNICTDLRSRLDPETADQLLTGAAYARKRNTFLYNQMKQPRSEKSISADAKRLEAIAIARTKKKQAQLDAAGQFEELEEEEFRIDVADYFRPPQSKDESEEDNTIDTGERSDDEDYSVSEQADSDDEMNVGPRSKAPKTQENTYPSTRHTRSKGTPVLVIKPAEGNRTQIQGMFQNVHDIPTYEVLFGENFKYFTNFQPLIEDPCKGHCFSFELSKEGKQFFKGRTAAINHVGHYIQIIQ